MSLHSTGVSQGRLPPVSLPPETLVYQDARPKGGEGYSENVRIVPDKSSSDFYA